MGIKDCYRVERVSKAGKVYQVLVIRFENGYVFETFLTNEQVYILNDILLK